MKAASDARNGWLAGRLGMGTGAYLSKLVGVALHAKVKGEACHLQITFLGKEYQLLLKQTRSRSNNMKNIFYIFSLALVLATLRAEDQTLNSGEIAGTAISYQVSMVRGANAAASIKILLSNSSDIPYYFYDADAPWGLRWLSVALFADRRSGDLHTKWRSNPPYGLDLGDGVGLSGTYTTIKPKGTIVGFYPLAEVFDGISKANADHDLYVGWSFGLKLYCGESPYKAAPKNVIETGRVGGFLILPRHP